MEATHVIGDKIFSVTYTRLKDVSGKFIGLAILFNDITAKRRTESVLEESESLRKAFMEGIEAAALVLDMENQVVVDYNSKVMGYSLPDLPVKVLKGIVRDFLQR